MKSLRTTPLAILFGIVLLAPCHAAFATDPIVPGAVGADKAIDPPAFRPVPEPAAIVIGALGMLLLLRRKK